MSYRQYEQTRFQPPKITWAVQRLILANVLVFVAQLLVSPVQLLLFGAYTSSHMFPGGILNTWFGFQPDLVMIGLVWKPFTYMFLHSGVMHLFMNMLWLFMFGPEVERTLGTRQFFRFFVACGAVGVLATFIPFAISGGVERVSVIGASGAAMGVMVAFAMIDPDRQFHLFPFPWPITARGLVILVVVMNIIMSLDNPQVSVPTHFGGMAVGFAYIKYLPALNRWQRKRKFKVMEKPEETSGPPPNSTVGRAVDDIFDSKKKDS